MLVKCLTWLSKVSVTNKNNMRRARSTSLMLQPITMRNNPKLKKILKEVVDDSQDHFNENFCNSEIRESKLMKTISRKSSEIFER